MIFSKDESVEQLPYTQSQKFMLAKVFVSAIIVGISIFLCLISKESVLGVFVLVFGIVWNFFTPINDYKSLILCICQGILYGLVCLGAKLVANAFLYIAYYVPLQYLAIKNEHDMFIIQKKQLTEKESLFVFFYYLLFFTAVYLFSSTINNNLLCLFDAVTASLLALSALVRNLRAELYYKVRLVALGASIFMWTVLVSGSAPTSGTISVLMMYIAYFIYDFITMIMDKKNYKTKQTEILEQKKEKLEKKLAESKKKSYAETKNAQ